MTHCRSLKEHCKIECPSCKWELQREGNRSPEPFKTKHGGFTPSQVSGQNSFEEFIPGLVEIGVEERDMREMASQSAANISSRADRLAKFQGARADVLG